MAGPRTGTLNLTLQQFETPSDGSCCLGRLGGERRATNRDEGMEVSKKRQDGSLLPSLTT